jgi:alkaline phosphatase D
VVTRRQLIGAAGALSALVAAPSVVHAMTTLWKWRSFPFTLGVASGALASDGFVIWTRLAPEPLSMDPALVGGLSGGDIPLRFEIAEDEVMRRVVKSGTAVAEARYAYSVHHLVRGLKPGRSYWYRFVSGDATSRIGRATTLPAADATLDKLRVGYVSCSNYETGYFSAYRHLAAELPDVVLCLGDYIYEYVDKVATHLVRQHSGGTEPVDLQAIAIVTRSIGSTRICSGCMPLRQHWSPGMITKSTTTTPICCRNHFKIPPSSRSGARLRTARSMNTCQ